MASKLLRRLPKPRSILESDTLLKSVQNRGYCASVIPPLNEALPNTSNVPKTQGLVGKVGGCKLKTTTLSNGLKVASEDCFGQFGTVGVVIDAGSRYEIDYTSGITHVLEKLAFQSTSSFSNFDEIAQYMESLGGHMDCQSFRDCMVYAASAYKHEMEGIIKVLSEAMWKANITDQEVAEQKETVAFELESLDFRPDLEPQLTDLIHWAAFNSNTLGLPKICPGENLEHIDSKNIHHYIRRYFRPERITLAGVNVDHDELVKYCQKYLVDDAPEWTTEKGAAPDRSIAQYTGGQQLEHRAEPRLQPGITQLPELAHVAIGFESADYTDKDMFAFAVLNMLLGGGGSFSAGGPGKGMYSRLYTNVLNRHHWMYSSTAFNHSYADSGLFCIHSSCHPSQAKDLVRVITQEYLNLVMEPFHAEEVARSKKQLQSMLMMNLESRVVRFEDIGRQVLGLGERKSPQELYALIEAVTASDLKRISESMLSTKPSVAAIGNLNRFPQYEEIQQDLLKRNKHSRGFSQYFFGR